jgi:acetoin utilization deacetylase AcuC-like enzyme
VQRAAVADLDVHQGDGTASIFSDDPDVYTLSIHGEKNFPLRKQVSRRDVGLADGTGDDEYLEIVARELPALFEFRPEIVFFQAGVDGLSTDRLGRLRLTRKGLLARDRPVLETCAARNVPVVITIRPCKRMRTPSARRRPSRCKYLFAEYYARIGID